MERGVGTDHFLTGEKKWAEVPSCHCEGKFMAHHRSVGAMKCTSTEAKTGQVALLLWWKMRTSRIALWLVPCSSLHKSFSAANGFAGHARGNGLKFIFPSSLWKMYQDISLQAIPLSPIVPIHVLGPISIQYWVHGLPGPTSSARIPETLSQGGRLCRRPLCAFLQGNDLKSSPVFSQFPQF